MQVAVAFSVLEFQRQPADASTDSFIWDVSNPSQPEATLSPASPLVCINFNLKDQKASDASASLDVFQGRVPIPKHLLFA